MNEVGQFVVSWLSGSSPSYDVYARRFAGDGLPLESQEFKVNATADTMISSAAAIDADGRFLVAWSTLDLVFSTANLYARRYDAEGSPLGSVFRVNQRAGDVHYIWPGPSVTMNASGQFVFAWQSCFGGFCAFDARPVYRRFSETGAPLDAEEVAVSSLAGESHSLPVVGIDAAGDFVVAWDRQGLGDIYARRFAASGTPIGDAFLIHDVTAGAQEWPAVSMEPGGAFALAWASERQDADSLGVFTRRFDFRPDVQLEQFTADGEATLTFSYRITGSDPVDSLEIGVYRASEPDLSGGVEDLGSFTITAASDLTDGEHVKTIPIGSGAGQIPLPGAGSSAVDEDYYLAAVADPGDAIREQDSDPFDEDNTRLFVGAYRTTSGDVYVHGGQGPDATKVEPGSVAVTLNGTTYTYASDDVTTLHIRGHEGRDRIEAASSDHPLKAWGGAGDDVIVGGGADDVLDGGPGGR